MHFLLTFNSSHVKSTFWMTLSYIKAKGEMAPEVIRKIQYIKDRKGLLGY